MTGELIVDLATAATRHPRWHEYGRPTTPVKAGHWPPASGGLKALTGACCSAFVSHQERFDGEVRAAQAASQFTFAEPNLTQTIGHSPAPCAARLLACILAILTSKAIRTMRAFKPPQYEITNSKTEHVAFHKGSALTKLRD
jgi:hypothetical protein